MCVGGGPGSCVKCHMQRSRHDETIWKGISSPSSMWHFVEVCATWKTEALGLFVLHQNPPPRAST